MLCRTGLDCVEWGWIVSNGVEMCRMGLNCVGGFENLCFCGIWAGFDLNPTLKTCCLITLIISFTILILYYAFNALCIVAKYCWDRDAVIDDWSAILLELWLIIDAVINNWSDICKLIRVLSQSQIDFHYKFR